ncbi:MAG: hypothetical protein JXA19_04225 [Anaerolineales bacterium]|nr:hypothetical protein [Anaerolineales bacterium]
MVLCLFGLSSCNPVPVKSIPTLSPGTQPNDSGEISHPQPTWAVETVEEGQPAPLESQSQPVVNPDATAVFKIPPADSIILPSDPEITNSANPVIQFPVAAVQILRPGTLSHLTTPFIVVANLTPGYENLVYFRLLDQNGSILDETVETANFPDGYVRVNVVSELSFSFEGISQIGYVQAYVKDQFGRIEDLSSQKVLLFTDGYTLSYIPEDLNERITIQTPSPDVMISGGSIYISGWTKTLSENGIEIRLIDMENEVIARGNASVLPHPEDGYSFYAAEINYFISDPQDILISVSEQGENNIGPVHITGIHVILAP